MAQEFAHKIPRDIPTDCDQCGHMPRLDDVSVILPEFTGYDIVYHVRCYSCGHEWVDQYTYVYTTFMYTQPFVVYMRELKNAMMDLHVYIGEMIDNDRTTDLHLLWSQVDFMLGEWFAEEE